MPDWHGQIVAECKNPPSVDELLAMARDESVLIVSRDGGSFLLEEADDFDREVARLGNSHDRVAATPKSSSSCVTVPYGSRKLVEGSGVGRAYRL